MNDQIASLEPVTFAKRALRPMGGRAAVGVGRSTPASDTIPSGTLDPSEGAFRAIVEKSPNAMLIEAEGGIVFANAAAVRLLKADSSAQLRNQCVLNLVPAKSQATVAGMLLGTASGYSAHQLLGFDGRVLDVESIAVRTSFEGRPAVCVWIDEMTERIKLEQQFQQAQRLESIGMLASGIAHDLNNVLAPVLMAVPLLRDKVEDVADQEMLGAIESSAVRGAALIRQILTFARGVATDMQVIQVKHVVHETAEILRRTFSQRIVLQVNVSRDLRLIEASPTQMHQVLLNLCVNARDAMPSGGVLRVSAENAVLGAEAARRIPGGQPGRWVRIQVSDTGTGIAPEAMDRIWEPFFSTKAEGRGTGLGLSTVRGIVDTHGGFVHVESSVGRGTTFSVFFPWAESQLDVAAEMPAGNQVSALTSQCQACRSGKLVLVADDDPAVRMLAKETLSRHGYRVLVAPDGADALRLLAACPKDIGLVITDLDMPRLNGLGFISALRETAGNIPVVVMTGGNPDWSSNTPFPFQPDSLLQKPFSGERLVSRANAEFCGKCPVYSKRSR